MGRVGLFCCMFLSRLTSCFPADFGVQNLESDQSDSFIVASSH